MNYVFVLKSAYVFCNSSILYQTSIKLNISAMGADDIRILHMFVNKFWELKYLSFVYTIHLLLNKVKSSYISCIL